MTVNDRHFIGLSQAFNSRRWATTLAPLLAMFMPDLSFLLTYSLLHIHLLSAHLSLSNTLHSLQTSLPYARETSTIH